MRPLLLPRRAIALPPARAVEATPAQIVAAVDSVRGVVDGFWFFECPDAALDSLIGSF